MFSLYSSRLSVQGILCDYYYFLNINLYILPHAEKQREHDHFLVEREWQAEYNDDYDDQVREKDAVDVDMC